MSQSVPQHKDPPSTDTDLELDDLDYAILAALQNDGRKPFTDIAKDLGVSSSTIKNRYTRLVDQGVLFVTGYLNHARVGFKSPVIVLVKVKPTFLESAADKIATFPEVDYVAVTSGDYDLDLTVSCRDNDHLLHFIHAELHSVPGVVDTRTKMILRVIKNRQASVKVFRTLGRDQRTERGP